MKQIKNIAVLTSGGDAPGMNMAVRAVVRRALSLNIKPYVVIEGFKGLYENNIEPANVKLLDIMTKFGGTSIFTSRFEKFCEPEIRAIAIKNLKQHKIDALVIIGGNGSYIGAAKLQEEGVNVICLPGTIDNDIASTDYTIGFDTSLNTIVNAVENIRDTSFSHGHTYIIEIMGRKCSDLTIFAAYATGADYVVTSQNILSKEEFVKKVVELKEQHRRSVIVLVNEKMYGENGLPSLTEIKEAIEKKTNNRTKLAILGFIQRGGTPTALERFNATRMGAYAIELIANNNFGRTVGIRGVNLIDYDLNEALNLTPPDRRKMIETINLLNHTKKEK